MNDLKTIAMISSSSVDYCIQWFNSQILEFGHVSVYDLRTFLCMGFVDSSQYQYGWVKTITTDNFDIIKNQKSFSFMLKLPEPIYLAGE